MQQAPSANTNTPKPPSIPCWGAHASNSAWQPRLHLLHLPLGLSAHNTNRLLSMSLFLYKTIFIL